MSNYENLRTDNYAGTWPPKHTYTRRQITAAAYIAGLLTGILLAGSCSKHTETAPSAPMTVHYAGEQK